MIEVSVGESLGIEDAGQRTGVEAICKPVIDYHRALETRDSALLGSSVCDVVYRVYCTTSDRFADWEPWPRLTREQILKNFGLAFAREEFYYENRLEFTHTMLNGQEAFLRTIETGRTWKDRTWDNVEVLWHSTRTSEETWQIAGHIYHLT